MAEKRTSSSQGATTKKPSDEPSASPEAETGVDTPQAVHGPADPERIEAEIEETREGLAETVAALADKTNVKKQAKQKVDETKEKARETATQSAESAKQAFDDMPEWAKDARNKATAVVRENPALAAGVVAALLLLVIKRSR